MHGLHETARKAPQRGLFLFFVLGMFMLQIAFAFTIHGDIGPRTAVAPGIDRPAPAALVGRIDSLLTSSRASVATSHGKAEPAPAAVSAVAPVAAVAPAQKSFAVRPSVHLAKSPAPVSVAAAPSKPRAAARTEAQVSPSNAALKTSSGGRYHEYTISRGDTLDSISRKLYGSTQMVTAIVRLNRLADDRTLRCGETLRVPRVGLKVASR